MRYRVICEISRHIFFFFRMRQCFPLYKELSIGKETGSTSQDLTKRTLWFPPNYRPPRPRDLCEPTRRGHEARTPETRPGTPHRPPLLCAHVSWARAARLGWCKGCILWVEMSDLVARNGKRLLHVNFRSTINSFCVFPAHYY